MGGVLCSRYAGYVNPIDCAVASAKNLRFFRNVRFLMNTRTRFMIVNEGPLSITSRQDVSRRSKVGVYDGG